MAISLPTWPSRLLARPWLLSFVPINAATGGFGVVLPLLILIPLHGSWSAVALSATLYNSAVILSSVLWGHLSDRFHLRRAFLAINYGGFALLYIALTQVQSLGTLYAIYAVIGLIAPAGASASNLLLLEKFPGKERANAYSSFQEMSIIGSIVGLLIGFVWTTNALALSSILYVLGALAAVSAVWIWFGVSEGARPHRTSDMALHPESLFSRMRRASTTHNAFPFFPVRPPISPRPFDRFGRWAREEIRHEIPLIFLAMFLFNLSANLYNISFTPYLTSIGIAASSIFLINLSNSAAQGLLFPFTGALTTRIGPDRLVRSSTYLRSLGYLATAAFPLIAWTVPGAFGANAIVYGVLGAAVAFFTISSSMMLFRGLHDRDAGRLLGVNSALGGVAAVAGAGLSGVIAIFGSFQLVFLVAAGGLLASLPIWAAATVAYERRTRPKPLETALQPPSSGAPSTVDTPRGTETA